jgi:hypothetical protein
MDRDVLATMAEIAQRRGALSTGNSQSQRGF